MLIFAENKGRVGIWIEDDQPVLLSKKQQDQVSFLSALDISRAAQSFSTVQKQRYISLK